MSNPYCSILILYEGVIRGVIGAATIYHSDRYEYTKILCDRILWKGPAIDRDPDARYTIQSVPVWQSWTDLYLNQIGSSCTFQGEGAGDVYLYEQVEFIRPNSKVQAVWIRIGQEVILWKENHPDEPLACICVGGNLYDVLKKEAEESCLIKDGFLGITFKGTPILRHEIDDYIQVNR